jgi:hypothetical protein
VHHTLEEKTPGAKLAREEAQAKAETYLREEKKLDLQQWKLVDSSADARPARTDHHFVWEEKQAVAGSGTDAAHVRAELNVLGDEVSGYRVFVKIPEQWERDQKKRTLPRVLRTVWTVALFAGLGVAALVLFFKNLRQQTVPWRRMAKWALAALAGSALATFSNLPSVMATYPTAIPLATFKAIMSVSLFLAVLFGFASAAVLLGLAWFYLARAFGEQKLPGWSRQPAGYYRDALILGVSGTAALAGLGRLSYLASQALPTLMRSLEAAVPSNLDAYLPAAEAIGHALSTGIMATALAGLAAGFIACHLRQRWMLWALWFAAALALAGDWGSPADFAKRLVIHLLTLILIWAVVRQIVRFNAMAYFLIGGLSGLLPAAAVLLKQPNAFLRMNGWMAVGAAAVLLAWPLVAWRVASQTGAPTAAGALGS